MSIKNEQRRDLERTVAAGADQLLLVEHPPHAAQWFAEGLDQFGEGQPLDFESRRGISGHSSTISSLADSLHQGAACCAGGHISPMSYSDPVQISAHPDVYVRWENAANALLASYR